MAEQKRPKKQLLKTITPILAAILPMILLFAIFVVENRRETIVKQVDSLRDEKHLKLTVMRDAQREILSIRGIIQNHIDSCRMGSIDKEISLKYSQERKRKAYDIVAIAQVAELVFSRELYLLMGEIPKYNDGIKNICKDENVVNRLQDLQRPISRSFRNDINSVKKEMESLSTRLNNFYF